MKLRIFFFVGAISMVALGMALNKTFEKDVYVSVITAEKDSLQSLKAFTTMMDVITHPRCMNCHPTDNVPKQGDDRHAHYFGIARGEEDFGFEATNCNTCHQSENNLYSGVPGAPHWALAPASMGWQGLSRTKIAERLLNKETNGNKTNDELIKHMTEDELVLWAWEPGVDAQGNPRNPPPVSKEEFKEVVEVWFRQGALIPNKKE